MTYRPELEQPLPSRMAKLPVVRGYPVPWFVEWAIDGKAVPIGKGEADFRLMSHDRLLAAVKQSRCWVCGGVMHGTRVFLVGPMCAVNRVSAEPPSHRDCAEWSARNCPFMVRPHARRRTAGMPEGHHVAGKMIERNPGVMLVWASKGPSVFNVANGFLFDIGQPISLKWYAEGRPATRAEIMASIDSGLPLLREEAEKQGDAAVAELEKMTEAALRLVA